MRVRYSKSHPLQKKSDSMPRLSLVLRANGREIEAIALVDSGAMVSVMPFQLGQELGMMWNPREAKIELGGIASDSGAIPILVPAQFGDYEPVDLLFAWTKRNDVPLILGQVDFFRYFRVCFEGYNYEFEITPRPR